MSTVASKNYGSVDARYIRSVGEIADIVAVRRVVAYDLSYKLLTAADTTQTITLGELQEGELIEAAYFDLSTVFAGGTIAAMTMEVGRAAATDSLILAADVFTGATTGLAGIAATGLGEDLMLADGTVEVPLPPYPVTAAENLVALFTSTTGDVNEATTGQVRIYVVLGPNLSEAYVKNLG